MVQANTLQQSFVEGERRRLARDHARVSKICPTPSWSEAYRRGEAFPPRADDRRSQMVKASEVLHWTELSQFFPTYYIERGKTFERRLLENDRLREALDLVDHECPQDYTPEIRRRFDLSGERPLPKKQMQMRTENVTEMKKEIARFIGQPNPINQRDRRSA